MFRKIGTGVPKFSILKIPTFETFGLGGGEWDLPMIESFNTFFSTDNLLWLQLIAAKLFLVLLGTHSDPTRPLEVLGPGFRANIVWFVWVCLFSQTIFADPPRKWLRAASRDTAESKKCVARCSRFVRKLWSSQFSTHRVYACFVGWTCFPFSTGYRVCYERWTLIKSTWVWMAGVYLMSRNASALRESWGFCLRDLAEPRSWFESRKGFFFIFICVRWQYFSFVFILPSLDPVIMTVSCTLKAVLSFLSCQSFLNLTWIYTYI